MSSILRRDGLGRDLLAIGSCAVAAGLLAWLATPEVLGGLALAAVVGLFAGGLEARRRRRTVDAKLSAEMTLLSERLLRLEARAAGESDAARRATGDQLSAVSDDLDLLSGLVRDLAETVAVHDRRIGTPAAAVPDRSVSSAPDDAAPASRDPAPVADPAGGSPDMGRIAPSLLPFLLPLEAPRAPSPTDTRPDAAPPAPPPASRVPNDPFVEAVDAGRIEFHLQSIVSLPQRHTCFYEGLARLEVDGRLVLPHEFLPVLRRHGRMPTLDRAAVARAIVIAGHLAASVSTAFVAVNLSPESLADAAWEAEIERLAAAHPDAMRRLAFEMSQDSREDLGPAQHAALARLRDFGARLALDGVTDPFGLDPDRLRADGIAYVKLNAEMIRAPAPDHLAALPDLLAALSRNGVEIVAEHVESEAQIPDLIDMDIPFAQGFACSKPRPVRSDLSTATAADPGTGPDATIKVRPEDKTLPHDGRTSLREFLRRAG